MDPESITQPYEDDSGDESVDKPGKRSGRRKIKIEYIEDKNRRHITFSKRKSGIMKKAYELSTLTGTQVLLLVVSETGLVYTFTTAKLQPIVTNPEGKSLIQACLNAPDPNTTEMQLGTTNRSSSPQSNSVDERHDPNPSSSSTGGYKNNNNNNDGVNGYPSSYPAGQTENDRPPPPSATTSYRGFPPQQQHQQQHPHYQYPSTTQPSYGMPYYGQTNLPRPPYMPPPPPPTSQPQEY